jgi:hypothetical protein
LIDYYYYNYCSTIFVIIIISQVLISTYFIGEGKHSKIELAVSWEKDIPDSSNQANGFDILKNQHGMI